jgi:hypothetical protein
MNTANLWASTSGPTLQRLIDYHTLRAEKHPDPEEGRWSAEQATELQRWLDAMRKERP